MSEQFSQGNVYVFSNKKYRAVEGNETYKYNKEWVNISNGRKIKVIGKFLGTVGEYWVFPTWCKCIENNVTKKKGNKK